MDSSSNSSPEPPASSKSDFDVAVEKAKLDAMKELAYGASHEINNPLANIAARAQTLLRDEADPERRRALAAIHAQAMRAHEMISDLMLFARPPRLEIVDIDAPAIVREAVEKVADEADERHIRVSTDLPDIPLACRGDAVQLAVATLALIRNAMEAIGCDGQVCVACRKVNEADNQWVEIDVTDDGPGISNDIRQHLFDPFFSGREAGRGLGFGLSKCWRIVTEHGGDVVVQSEAGHGARFTIRLPGN